MMTPLSAMLAAVLFAQDSTTIRELVDRLGDDNIEQRDLAQMKLVRSLEAAVPSLEEALTSDDLEVVQRAQDALLRIDQRIRLRPVYRERIPFSLDLQGVPLGEALARISDASHVTCRARESIAGRKVTLRMKEGTLLEAVDRLCRSLGDLQWSYDDQGVIGFRSQPFISKPSSYADCFRISLRRVETQRSTNFMEEAGTAALYLEATVEHGVKALGAPVFSITEAVDDGGNVLTPWAHPSHDTCPRMEDSFLLGGEPPSAESQPFWFSGLGASARRLGTVRGTTTFYFSLGSQEVLMDCLSGREPLQFGEWNVQVLANHGGILKIGVSRGEQPIDLVSLETESVVVDEKGDEHHLVPSDCEGYQLPENRYTVLTLFFDRAWNLQASRISLRLIQGVHELRIPFEFRDVPLP